MRAGDAHPTSATTAPIPIRTPPVMRGPDCSAGQFPADSLLVALAMASVPVVLSRNACIYHKVNSGRS